MSFSEVLSEAIKESQYSLRQIAMKCDNEYNLKIDPSYISKLQSGKQSPPSDEVTETLAKVLGIDPDKLLFYAYMEKAPEIIKKFFSSLENYLRTVLKNYMLMNFPTKKPPKEVIEAIEKKIDNLPMWEIVQQIIKQDYPFGSENNQLFLKSHDPKLKNMIINVNNVFGLTMPDNSMEPLIKKGSLLNIDGDNKPANGDIVIALKENNNYYVRNYFDLGTKVLLTAENKKFQPINEDKNNFKAIVRVKSYVTELEVQA